MRSEPGDATVSTLLFRPILVALEKAGIDVKAFAASVDLPLAALGDRDGRLPRELAIRTWLAASAATGDDVLGLHIAEAAPAGTYGVLEYAIRSTATVGEALRQFARYYRIVSSMSSLSIETTADVVRVVHEGAGTPPAVVDNVFAVIVRVGRELTGTPLVPREVKLTRAAPRDPADHQRFFCPHVHFASREDALVFDAAALDLPLMTADAELHLTLERRTEELLGTVPSRDRFVSRVRVAIVKSLQAGTGASLAALAEALDMSARTLQRRLGDSSTTRSDLVDDVRHELAVRYVRGDLGSTEIAYLLGFSDAAALHRAFKRWTGTTLKDHRAEEREKR